MISRWQHLLGNYRKFTFLGTNQFVTYTSNSSRWLRVFTKRLCWSSSYMKSDFSSTGDCSGVWFRDGAGDGPLMESVGRRFLKTAWWFSFVASDILCVRGMSGFVLSGSLWHSTISIVSWFGDIRVSSLSQILLCEGFSEKRRCHWKVEWYEDYYLMKLRII